MIAFSINDKSFTRILQMKPGMSDDEPCFLVSDRGTPVLYSPVPYFGKQLFGALIRVARGEQRPRRVHLDAAVGCAEASTDEQRVRCCAHRR
ncbi:MAG: hypothetical protein U0105_06700 [Candidatus Obscuribacterales bacterium]